MAHVHVPKVVATTGLEPENAETERVAISARLVAMIEAKSLAPSAAFVGFTYKPPTTLERRSLRCRFAGSPSNGVLGFGTPCALDLAASLDPLNDAPYCVQWVLLERNEKGEVRDSHQWAIQLNNLVRGIHLHMSEHSKFLLESDAVRIDFFEPTLFIKTPALFLFDAMTKTVTKTDRLTLAQHFEVAGAKQEHRLIDVVAGDAVGEFATRYKKVKANLEGAVDALGSQLVAAAREQRKQWRARTAVIPDSLYTLGK